MNQTTALANVLFPTEFERQQIFYWLQRISSITAWRRILDYYRAWVNTIEKSFRLAVELRLEHETSPPESSYVQILRDLAHCENGVTRLAKGDKKIFKFDANGEFAMAGRILSHWSQMLDRIEWGDNGINKHTPLWPQFCESFLTLAAAWRECSPYIVERRYLDEPALVTYGEWVKRGLVVMPFPGVLPPVPDPVDNIFVRTNEWTPFTGIWEPISGESVQTSPVRQIFSRVPKPQPPFAIVGAMNYLHGGSNAPTIKVQTYDDTMAVDTTWRLLWRDDRYQDGTVPEVESHYMFAEPRKIRQRPAFWETGETPWADTGDEAPFSGIWGLTSSPVDTVTLRAGDKVPSHLGTDARWLLLERSR